MRHFIITNNQKFNDKVTDVDVSGIDTTIFNPRSKSLSFSGSIAIDFDDRGWVTITGDFGESDYEEDYGFVITDTFYK